MNTDKSRTAAGLLADLVLGDHVRAASAVRTVSAARKWPVVVSLARAWRVLPPVIETLRDLEIELPEDERDLLRRNAQDTAVQSTLVVHRAVRLLGDLEAAGVEAMAFKGVALIGGLYGNPAHRMISDIDLLIPERSVDVVVEMLRVRGLVPRSYDSVAHYRSHRPGVRSQNHALSFCDAQGVETDLHWRLGERPDAVEFVESLLDRAVETPLLGQVIRTPAPEDSILLSVHHLIRSDLRLASLFKDLRDILSWCVLRPESWSDRALISRARDLGMEPAVLACWEVIAAGNDNERVAEGIGLFRSCMSADQIQRATAITRLILHRIEQGRSNADLVAFYQPGALRRWLRSRVSGSSGARDHDQPAAAGPSRRVARLVLEILRQRGFEHRGYRALAAIRSQMMDRESH